MRIISWNVNSIKARHDRFVALLERHEPDVVCLQELKVVDDVFPFEQIKSMGYHAAVFGQRAYNGVAVVSRREPTDIQRGLGFDGEDDARFVSARVGDTQIVSAYVPNGRSVGSDSFAYKLRWLAHLKEFVREQNKRGIPLVVSGDFNCAPEERDVARPDEWRDTVLCHADVRAAVEAIKQEGLKDTLRLVKEDAGLYSWWDYRRLGFPKNNGLRIDQIYVTDALANKCKDAWIDRNERKGGKDNVPSDHAPVVADFEDA